MQLRSGEQEAQRVSKDLRATGLLVPYSESADADIKIVGIHLGCENFKQAGVV